MTNPSDRELAVFSTARRLPAGARAAYLNEACADDAALRQRVEALLLAREGAGAFLHDPAPGAARPPAGAPPPGDEATRLIPGPPAEKAGDRVGRYKLLQQIGEGGCGIVYMAEQQEPVRRMVALKVIKLGMDTKQVIARFEAERQALALMDHPNIAKVLDAGATNIGRPYFVMELVRGIKITEYCDQNNLPTRQRLDLFVQVCQAIQHAHQKGVIHRDIKPSNILVTLRDGVPVPKVIDFGIAKATNDQRLTDKTLFTAFEQFIGTPAYMSPEQAEMSELGIDTRSDIYSLGVLLYELLTGQTPFDAKDLLQAGLDAMRRIIREQEPARPSTRVSTLLEVELTRVANHRQTDALKLVHLLRGDLDWIVIKSLEKDRARRYETANGLARDIQRYLSDEPVVARPPSNLYRFQKLVRRNKLAFSVAGAVTTALVIGLGISSWMFIREKQARRQAEADRKTARTEAAKSRQVAQFLKDMIRGVGPSVALGRDTVMLREILDRTAGRVDQELTSQPLVALELCNLVGGVYWELGQYQKAEAMHRQALELARRWLGNQDETVADSLQGLANALRPTADRRGEAEAMLREALEIVRKKHGNENPHVAGLLHDLAYVIYWRGPDRLPEAETTEREALAMLRKLSGNESLGVAGSLNNLAFMATDEGHLGEAEAMLRESLAIDRNRSREETTGQAMTLYNLADLLKREHKLAEAEAAYRDALAIRKKLLGENHTDTVISLTQLADVLLREGKLAEAASLCQEALTGHQNQLESVVGLFGRMGRWTDAASCCSRLIELEPTSHWFYFVLAPLLVQTGDLEGYRRLCVQFPARFSGTGNPMIADRVAKACLLQPLPGVDLVVIDHLAETAVSLGSTDRYLAYFQVTKGLAEFRQGRFTEAAVWLQKAIDNKSNPDANRYLAAYVILAMTESRMKRTDEARAALAKGIEIEKGLPRLGEDLGGFWMDWIIGHVLLKEAKALIEGPSVVEPAVLK